MSVASSLTALVSGCATGAGLVAVKVKVWLIVAPWLSVAVTVMLYTPSLPGPPWLASGFSVPVIRPLTGSIDRPVGRPLAL